MPKINVKKSIKVDAPLEKVYETVSNFNKWIPWSPWLIQEPGVKVTVSDDAKYYEWEGQRVGTGNMTIIGEKENESVDYDLLFLKPWKSKAKVRFELKQNGNGTEITWLMDSSLPFFMFWMKKMMVAFIGMDYDRGLAMLKDYVEDGEVHSKLDFKGNSEFAGFKYVGIKTDCTRDTVGPKMQEDFGRLWEFLKDKESVVAGKAFSIYHKWDMVNGNVSYTSGVPVNEVPDNLPSGFVVGEIPKTPVYTLKHTGPYAHLGNAWTTLYGMQRAKDFKVNKSIHPFETYENEPGKVPDNELVTEVHFAVK